jgi:hypothetical protein
MIAAWLARGGIASLIVVSCASAPVQGQPCPGPPCFRDVGVVGAIDLGTAGGGMAVIDFDGDGYVDLVMGGRYGEPNRLWRNVEHPRHHGRRTFVDVTAGSGLDDDDGVFRLADGIVVADYDNDGDSDVFITGWTPPGSNGLLYRNDGGGRFTNVSIPSGVRRDGYKLISASWNDYDLDGFVDLLAGGWGFGYDDNFLLLHNEGNGTFSDASDLLPEIPSFRTVFAHLWMDYDQDGYADGFILDDHGPGVLLKNVDDGAGGRRFDNVALETGFHGFQPLFPMGIAAGDYDGDGDLDVAVSTIGAGNYFENRGDAFAEIFPFSAIWGWGVDWIDADNDGALDFYMAGSFNPGSGAGANLDKLFHNLGGARFVDATPGLNGVSAPSKHSIQLDIDNDGRQDLITCNPGVQAGYPSMFVSVYLNLSQTNNHWITLRLRGRGRSNRDAVGAVARITAGGKTQVRELISGSSTTATEDLRLHFGLGSATEVEHIQILWPRRGSLSSRLQTYGGPFKVDRMLTLDEPLVAPGASFGNSGI